VGRRSESELINSFLVAAAREGGALLLVGEPGVGKTALLRSAAEAASALGTRVLQTEGVQFEAEVAFSGLAKALLPVLDEIDGLDSLYRDALRTAIGLGQGSPADRLVVSNAALGLLTRAAVVRPLMLVVDDLQWLDRPSSGVLSFVSRRLAGSAVGFLAAARAGTGMWFDQGGLAIHEVEPLDDGAARELLQARSPALAPAVRSRLLTEAMGNPLALLELPTALTAPQRVAVQSLPTVLPLTDRLQDVFASRVRNLPPASRELLLLAVLDGTAELAVLSAASGDPQLQGITGAERARLVDIEPAPPRVVFRHPLLRSAIMEASTPDERRRAHVALADALVDHPEQRAWHLAEASEKPDETVAELLEQASQQILRRGDASGALAALLRAAELSPRPVDRGRRLAKAAYIGADVTGDLGAVSHLLEEAEQADPDLSQTLGAALGGAYLLLNSDGEVETAHRLLVAALEAYPRPYDPADATIVAALTVLLAVCNFAGRPDLWGPFDAALARFTSSPPAELQLLSQTYPDPARRAAPVLDDLDAAIAALGDEMEQSRIIEVCGAAVYLDRLGACREPMWRVVHDGRESGAVAPAITALTLLAADDYLTGRWEEADNLLEEALGLCEVHGYRLLSWPGQNLQARLAAVRGDYEAASKITEEVSRWAEPRGVQMIRWNCCHTRALAALGQGDFDYAYQQTTAVTPVGTLAPYVPQALWVGMDLVEAAVHSGRRKEAATHVAIMREQGIAALSPRLTLLTAAAAAMAAREDRAGDLFNEALALPGADRWPFDLARVQLAHGEQLRRAGARDNARWQLAAARDTFRWLGAEPWAVRAGRELRASGESQVPDNDVVHGQLSDQEREIASLAAAGMTNKQIGARLFLSHRTVAAHLYRIFPKLGISSRAALADALERITRPEARGGSEQ
jgi:DNA-binding CsgD family transcriptional regulator/tetratricopeptide (TPR) repeat protein